ncbi:MAG: leucine-rich repeat domain-containing protein [Salinivirgaceae bacterium]|nr:leucine-rich repeat domain-containing protein [Salinivirgaceae bacterium]
MKKLLFILLIVMFTTQIKAQGTMPPVDMGGSIYVYNDQFPYGDLLCTITKRNDDKHFEVSVEGGYMAKYDDIIIIDSVLYTTKGRKYVFTALNDRAFAELPRLVSVIIPNSVTSIGTHAFYNCNSLKKIIISDSITSISDYMFCGCVALDSLTIPKSVVNIGNCAFYNCKGLTSIIIPNSVINIGKVAFADCTSLTSVNISNSVTTIGAYAFNNCQRLTSITIPKSVISIGKNAFSDCKNLTIHCEADSKPEEWDKDWNPNNRPVIWGYKGDK